MMVTVENIVSFESVLLASILIAHLHDDIMRKVNLICVHCIVVVVVSRKTKWHLMVVAGLLAVFQDVLATVKERQISCSMVYQKKRSCGVVGYIKYPAKISPRALDTWYGGKKTYMKNVSIR